MKKKLFLHLLKEYTKDEKGRVEVLEQLAMSVSAEYYNQTHMGNLYNLFTEVLISNSTFEHCCGMAGEEFIDMIKVGIINTVTESARIVNDKQQHLKRSHGF